jgi:hypothetical protein
LENETRRHAFGATAALKTPNMVNVSPAAKYLGVTITAEYVKIENAQITLFALI